MIHWTTEDAPMLAYVVSEMNEHVMYDGDFTDQDRATMTKLDDLAKAGAAVTVTSEPQDACDRAEAFRSIVEAELNAWIPNASQRLLHRAGAALGFARPNPWEVEPDCGPYLSNHATFPNWVGHWYVLDCANCARLFRA